jgi:hypothetical protein
MSAETAADARPRATPRPADAMACSALGCARARDLRPVNDGTGDVRVLCRYHQKYHLEVSS